MLTFSTSKEKAEIPKKGGTEEGRGGGGGYPLRGCTNADTFWVRGFRVEFFRVRFKGPRWFWGRNPPKGEGVGAQLFMEDRAPARRKRTDHRRFTTGGRGCFPLVNPTPPPTHPPLCDSNPPAPPPPHPPTPAHSRGFELWALTGLGPLGSAA